MEYGVRRIMIFGIAFFGFLLLSAPLSADNTVQHVVGTVTAIDKKHIEVKTPNKKAVVSVKLGKHVRFKNKSNPASTEPPAVGDHVIVEAKKEDKALTASVVHYSPMQQAPSTP
jgi:hypothetical protein